MATRTINPDPASLQLEAIYPSAGAITIVLRTSRSTVPCPECQRPTAQVHSWYRRSFTDLPWQGLAVRFRLHTRRWHRTNAACERRIFTERLLAVVAPPLPAARGSGRSGSVPALTNQLETVQVGGPFQAKLTDKRVLLLDNFLTWGYSTETGRNLAINAGAAEVVVACGGKYGPYINIVTPPAGSWDSFSTTRPPAAIFGQREYSGHTNRDALSEFLQFLRCLRDASW